MSDYSETLSDSELLSETSCGSSSLDGFVTDDDVSDNEALRAAASKYREFSVKTEI